MTTLLNELIEKLKTNVKGHVVLPDDPNYDEVRQIWNARIDRRPAVIVQCTQADDVARAIAFAQENKLEISIRGGGHNVAGTAVCDNGVMIDLSMMKNVRIDAEKRRAYVEAGATLGDFDSAAQVHGLATPSGNVSETGIAGLTLGGGFGWLSRKYGMTIDNLVSAGVVTADGNKIQASETENADLFWAIRGGGGNFGVVTEFEFKLHPVGPEILAGLIAFPFSQAKQILTQYRKFVESAPDELTVWVLFCKAPPLPFLPENVHGKEVVLLPVFYVGDIAEGEKQIEPLGRFGDAYGEQIGVHPYVEWQQAFNAMLSHGARYYWKSHNLTELRDEVLDTIVNFADKLPLPQCVISLILVDGAPSRVPANATAYYHRDVKFLLNTDGRWEDVAQDEIGIQWSRAFFQATAPYASAGSYVNFMTEEEGDRVAAVYGANYDRLVQIKKRYDPDNIFHLNQNIKPQS
ncbi:FAD-binding oxidoreductase [Nostoc sp. ChiQUE01b]|uniref:FAD-binding oxidoreductase n=1 Tax=Nostoc sp. ChiQUE01b TaxID=3075376 RepID=UPI002AD1E5E7|nr:FAD-binding oxidoreductase [Nostoc sp. ChiQUE01b]MDZ8257639.1 FAD-binding oxidoreductase [Nostoc sp. ChiQUE01b]